MSLIDLANSMDNNKADIQILNVAIGNLNATNEKIYLALRALNNDAVDKILGPTDRELAIEIRRKETLHILWEQSGINKPDQTATELKFAELYHELEAIQKDFWKKYYC